MPMRKSILVIAVGTLLGAGAVAAISATGERGPMRFGGWGEGRFGGKWHAGRMPRTQEEYDARTRERFARLDRNGDGVIDAAEIEADLSRRMSRRGRGGGEHMGQRMLRSMDADRDGKVSKEEFIARVRTRFAELDLNNDGKISDEDLPPMLRGRGVLSGQDGMRRGRRFALLRDADANKDGVVTLDEALAAGEKRFALADRNRDGIIDAADRDAMRMEMVDYRVKRFIHRYGADADGKVTKDQFYAKARERFARMDLDNDGTISREEWPGRDRGWRGHGRHGRGAPAEQRDDAAPAPRQDDGAKRN